MVGGDVYVFVPSLVSKTHLKFVIRSSQPKWYCSLKPRLSIPDFVSQLLEKNRKESLEGFCMYYGGTVTSNLQKYTSYIVFFGDSLRERCKTKSKVTELPGVYMCLLFTKRIATAADWIFQ